MNAVLLLCVIIHVTRGIIIQTELGNNNLSLPLVTLTVNNSLNIHEGTLCLKFYLLGSLGKYFLFSKMSSGRSSFSLAFKTDENYAFLFFETRKDILFFYPDVWPNEWFHFCLAYKNDGYHIVTNGKIWDTQPITVNDKKFENYFVETMTIGSMANGKDAFPGRISDLNIWNHAMTIDELKIITTSCAELQKQPNILKWPTVNNKKLLITNSKLAKYINEDEGMCSLQDKVKLYVALHDYETSKLICHNWGGEMYSPKSQEELSKILNDSSSASNNVKCGLALLPIYLNDQGEWEDTSKEPITSTDIIWNKGEPNGSGRQRCVVISNRYTFYDVFCSSKRCPFCKWRKNPVFLLKGLCPQSTIEYRYVLRINVLYLGLLAFKGFSNDYYILYDTKRETYVIAKSINFEDQNPSIDEDNIIGLGLNADTPMGLQAWRINDAVCNETISLKLTSVRIYLYKLY